MSLVWEASVLASVLTRVQKIAINMVCVEFLFFLFTNYYMVNIDTFQCMGF